MTTKQNTFNTIQNVHYINMIKVTRRWWHSVPTTLACFVWQKELSKCICLSISMCTFPLVEPVCIYKTGRFGATPTLLIVQCLPINSQSKCLYKFQTDIHSLLLDGQGSSICLYNLKAYRIQALRRFFEHFAPALHSSTFPISFKIYNQVGIFLLILNAIYF